MAKDLMLPWRETAARLLPELREVIAEAENPYMLWFALRDAFTKAYEQEPWDESLIRRVYQYASWCEQQPSGQTAENDLGTCVCVCFYEHIPQHPKSRDDMPRWFSLKEFETAQEIFKYHLTEQEFRAVHAHFRRHRKMFRAELRKL